MTQPEQPYGDAAESVAEPAPVRGGRAAVRLDENERRAAPVKPDAASRPNRKRQTRRGEHVRERILTAALECFGAFGFDGTSTRAVADRAAVAHTLVLYHFRSKDQLWIATMEAVLTAYVADMRSHLGDVAQRSAREALTIFIERFIRLSATRPQMHRILTMESNQGTPRLQWVIDHYLREHFGMVRDLIRRGQEEGTVRECDPARLYYLIIGAMGTPFTIATEYKALTGRNVFSESEMLRNIALIYDIIFV